MAEVVADEEDDAVAAAKARADLETRMFLGFSGG